MKKKKINASLIILLVILAAVMTYFVSKRSEELWPGILEGLLSFGACLLLSCLAALALTIMIHYMSEFLSDLFDMFNEEDHKGLDIIDNNVLIGLWGIIFIAFYVIVIFNIKIGIG